MAESACNLNKPEKQTQHCDTVKEELPVAKASLSKNNNNNSSRIKDVTEVERARYALFLLLLLAKDMCVGRCQPRLLISSTVFSCCCCFCSLISFIYLKAVYVLVKLQIKFLITN